MAGILDYGLTKVADLIIKYVVSPAVNYRLSVSFEEDLVRDSEEITEAKLKIVSLRDPKVDIFMNFSKPFLLCFSYISWN